MDCLARQFNGQAPQEGKGTNHGTGDADLLVDRAAPSFALSRVEKRYSSQCLYSMASGSSVRKGGPPARAGLGDASAAATTIAARSGRRAGRRRSTCVLFQARTCLPCSLPLPDEHWALSCQCEPTAKERRMSNIEHSTPNVQGTKEERHTLRGLRSSRVGKQPVARNGPHARAGRGGNRLTGRRTRSYSRYVSEGGRNSVVECQLPKLDVEGSNPFARSR